MNLEKLGANHVYIVRRCASVGGGPEIPRGYSWRNRPKMNWPNDGMRYIYFPHIHMSIYHINTFVERTKMSIRGRAGHFSNSFGESSPDSVFLVRVEYFAIDN